MKKHYLWREYRPIPIMKERPRIVDWLLDFVNRLLPVVTGIAITFTVQGMVNRAHTRRDVRSALQLVRTELVSNREDVAVLKEYLDNEMASARYLMRNPNLVKNLKRLESPIADTVKYHLGMVNADVSVVFPHDALELLKMSSLFQKIGDNALSMKIIRAYESCSYMTNIMDRHITERNAQPADSLYHWIEIHDTRVIADPTDIDKAITAINVFLRK